jgi:hypothetical protein
MNHAQRKDSGVKLLIPKHLRHTIEDFNREFPWAICQNSDRHRQSGDVQDIETFVPGPSSDPESQRGLEHLLEEGVALIRTAGDEKLNLIYRALLEPAGQEKMVLFAQPIETVTTLAPFLKKTTGQQPSLNLGGQNDAERQNEVEHFWRPDGACYLVSSREEEENRWQIFLFSRWDAPCR